MKEKMRRGRESKALVLHFTLILILINTEFYLTGTYNAYLSSHLPMLGHYGFQNVEDTYTNYE